MKYTTDVESTEEFFEKLNKSRMFTCKKSISGLSARYNGTFTLFANPKINLIKQSDKKVEIDILPSVSLIAVSVLFTLFFWAIGIVGIVLDKFSVPAVIVICLLPSIIWIFQTALSRHINKLIISEIEKLI